jgi:hypothetical protein
MASTLAAKIKNRDSSFIILLFRIKNKVKFECNKLINFISINNILKDNSSYFDDDAWNNAFEELKYEGICKLPIKIKIPAKYQSTVNLLSEKNYDNFIRPKETVKSSNKFGKCSIDLDINSEIFKSIFTKESYTIISNYYKRQFWVRNSPCLKTDIQKDRKEEYDQGFYHLDHCERQLSLVVLLNNTTNQSTHTLFINKTNQKSWFFQNHNRKSIKFMKKSKQLSEKNTVSKIVGNSGDVFLFDAGNGVHKGCYGSDRAMIHLNFAQMRYYAEYNENYEKIQLLNKNTHYDIHINEEFGSYLNKNSWSFINFKYTSNKF